MREKDWLRTTRSTGTMGALWERSGSDDRWSLGLLPRHNSRDRPVYPPSGVSREPVAAPVVELLHRLQEANVACLNQVRIWTPRSPYRSAIETTNRKFDSRSCILATSAFFPPSPIFLANSISPSLVSLGTLPISRR